MMTPLSGLVGLVLTYLLWVWWKDGHTLKPLYGRVGHRIRTALGVVSRDEMRGIQEYVQDKVQQLENRLRKVETTAKFSHQLQDVSKEMEQRVARLERSEGPQVSREPWTRLRPRSLIRLGVLVTLSDKIWHHLGTDAVNDMEDHLIDTMVQGPFCPVCLRRVVGRDRHKKNAEVLAHCRYCGVSWDGVQTVEYPLSLINFKRRVYQQLDQDYRAGKSIA